MVGGNPGRFSSGLAEPETVARQNCNIDHLGKGGYVVGSVGLSVCLSVDNITLKVMNGLG